MACLRRLWSDVSDADVQAAETLVHDVRQRHGGAETGAPPPTAPERPDSRQALPAQYRSTPDPSFGSRSLAQRRERDRLQRELIEAEAMAAHANALRRQETAHPAPLAAGKRPAGNPPQKRQSPGRADA